MIWTVDDMDRKEYPNRPSGRRIITRTKGVLTLLRGIFNKTRASSITLHTNNKQLSNTMHHAGAPAAHCCHLDEAAVRRETSSGGAGLHLLRISRSITIIAIMTSATARRRYDVTLLIGMTQWAVPHHKNYDNNTRNNNINKG
jgi:hypothetical protein